MKIFCTFVFVVYFVAVLSAQVPFLKKKDKEFQTHAPDAVASTLRSANPTQRSLLATELGITAPNFSDPAAKSAAPCVNFELVDERQVSLRADAENAVIIASSEECDSTYLIVFDNAKKSEWRHVQTVRLSSQVQHPEITFAELVQPGVSEIVVHHETTRNSGSAQQENFLVLKLLHDRLVPVLDTVERYDLVMPNRPENDADNVEQSQQSTFTVAKSDANTGPPTRILEKEVLKEKKVSLTLYRYWSWDPALERFRSTAYDGSDFAERLPPKKPAAKKAGAVQQGKDQQNCHPETNRGLAHDLFEFQGIRRHGMGWRFNHFQDLIGMADAVNYRNRAKHGDHPQHRAHAVEQCSDDDQHDALRPLHEANLAAGDERLGAGAGVAHHYRADHDESDHHHIEKSISAGVINQQPEEQSHIAIAINDGIEEAAELRDLIGCPGHTAIDHVENAGPNDDQPGVEKHAALVLGVGVAEQNAGHHIDQQTYEGERVR